MAEQCKIKHITRKTSVFAVICAILLIMPINGADGSGSTYCVRKGRLYTSLEWYGYLLQKTFQPNIPRIEYRISYPVSQCCVNLLIYYDAQMRNLSPEMTCREREKILPQSNNQLIPLTSRNGTVGCSIWREPGKEPMNVCAGERTFKSSAPRTWYIAVSRCNSSTPLTMNYQFNISGFYGKCEDDPLDNTHVPTIKSEENNKNLHIAIGMGVLAGIAVIVAIVFVTLYIISHIRNKDKPKTSGSVTSSQATMTQDIFYVNPSLSDREQSDSQYSRSSSENYYEVIPDRRSYESINTQLALHGHAHGHAHNGRTFQSLTRDPRSRIPSYIFEDVPPPPYQSLPAQGGGQGQGHGHIPQGGVPHGHIPQGSGQSHGHIPQSSLSGHQSQNSGSAHPFTQTSAALSHTNGGQHIPMTSRLLSSNSQSSPLNGPGPIVATTTRMPLTSSGASATMTSGNTLQVSNHSSSAGNHSSSAGNYSSAGTSSGMPPNQNGGITTSAGGLNSSSTGTMPRATMPMDDSTVPLQNGGPIQNGGLNHGTLGRYPLHNTNHAKLLHHAYRIQQFETTA